MPMMTLVMAMCECQLFYVFTKKVQQYGAQCIAVGLFSFLNILFIPDHCHVSLQIHNRKYEYGNTYSFSIFRICNNFSSILKMM